MIGQRSMRKLAILLLDDDNGIKNEAYQTLSIMLVESGNDDILDAVDMTNNRAYIGEDYAEQELLKIEELEKEDEIDGEGADT